MSASEPTPRRDPIINHHIGRREFLATVGAGVTAALLGGYGVGMAAAEMKPDGISLKGSRPNIIFVLSDDIGIQNITCFGGQSYKTPVIDSLAAGGMKFERCYAEPLCSPSRAKLLSGRFSFRNGDIDNKHALLNPDTEIPIPRTLKNAGYATAVCGKWHLGGKEAGMRAVGFDEVGPEPVLGPEDSYLPTKGKFANQYRPDVWQNWVEQYLDVRKSKPEPFFLYYPMQLVHHRFSPTPLNPGGLPRDPANYPYMMEYHDVLVGRLIKKLEETGLRKNTIVFYMGDNGTAREIKPRYKGVEVGGQKETMLDGGSWVPMLANCPGKIPAGSFSGLVDSTDFYPTILEMAGATMPGKLIFDGKSFAGALAGNNAPIRDYVFCQLGAQYFVRNAPHYKLRENGQLFDVANAPVSETLIAPEHDTPESAAARKELAAILATLKPTVIASRSGGGSVRPYSMEQNKFGVMLTTDDDGSVELIDPEGHTVMNCQTTDGSPVMIHTDQLKAGIYQMRICSGEESCLQALRIN